MNIRVHRSPSPKLAISTWITEGYGRTVHPACIRVHPAPTPSLLPISSRRSHHGAFSSERNLVTRSL